MVSFPLRTGAISATVSCLSLPADPAIDAARHAVIHGQEREGDVLGAGMGLRFAERALEAFPRSPGERELADDVARSRSPPSTRHQRLRGEGGRPECRLDLLLYRVEVDAERGQRVAIDALRGDERLIVHTRPSRVRLLISSNYLVYLSIGFDHKIPTIRMHKWSEMIRRCF
jgi:hypothetical protein